MKIRKSALLLCMLLVGLINHAANVPGYIITNENDTIHGFVQVSNSSHVAVVFPSSIPHFDTYSFGVTFKKYDEKAYKLYYPASIKEFNFLHNSTNYIFKRFTLKYKSIVKQEETRDQFLCLLYSNNQYQLYRNVLIDPNNGLISIPDKYLKYMIYYLYSPEKGIVKVEKSKKYNTIKALLLDNNFDPAFVAGLDNRLDFIDIKDILKQYHNSKTNQQNTSL